MIGVEANRIVYRGDGITTSFPYTFTVLEKADIVVTLVDKERKKKTLTGNYFIDMDKKEIIYPGYAPGEEPAEAERPPVLPEGWYLVIQRKTKIDQQTSLGDKWPFDVTEDALDKITRILQDLDTDSKRHLEVSVEASGIDPMLPSPKANMGFYWDETGTKLVEGLNPNAASESAAASASAAATSETNAAASANIAKAWSMSDSSPDGVFGNKSAKTWAEEAKASASNSANSASASNSSAETAAYYANKAMGYAEAPRGQAPNGSTSARVWAEIAGSKADAAASSASASASASASSASDASTSASNAKISETNAANSATSAAESAEKAKAYIATTYSKAEVDAKIPTKTSQLINDSEFVDTDTLVGSEQNLIAMIPTKTSQLTNNSGYITNADISLEISAIKAEVRADIPTKVSQLTNDAGYITKSDITEGSTPDLTPYMKKIADSDLDMRGMKLKFSTGTISSGFVGNQRPALIINASNSEGVNIKGPGVLVNGIPIATETDLSDKLDKTGTADKATRDGAGNVITETYATKADVSGVVKSVNGTKPDSNGNVSITVSGGSNVTVDTTLSATSTNPIANKTVYSALGGKLGKTETAYAATKATQDGAGNVIATTYIKTVNNLKPDLNGNVNISGGTGGNITVDSVLSPTSTNAIQNRVVQQEFTSVRATIPTKVSQLTNDSGYLTQHQSLDGYVKTVNNTAPDRNGNVTIALSGGGGVSTSESNTWTGKQTFQKMKFNFESYNAPRISGAIDNPSESVAVYNVQGNFTLDMSELAGLLSNGDATVFTAYITANGSYTLSITNAGTLKYAGSATDLAITANGLLLNIILIKSSNGVLSSVAQASTLS